MGRRNLRVIGAAALVTTLAGWGTLSEPVKPGFDKEQSLRNLITKYGVDPGPLLAELDDRSGPHPIHQFIAYQAYLLLKLDPAYSDGESGFPTGEEINAWDGIERVDGFMQPRPPGATGLPTSLAPSPIPGIGGPSADAERMRDKGFNKLYNGRAHYWNPWFEDGEAPKLAG